MGTFFWLQVDKGKKTGPAGLYCSTAAFYSDCLNSQLNSVFKLNFIETITLINKVLVYILKFDFASDVCAYRTQFLPEFFIFF